MSFNEWLNNLYGCEIDICDLTEEDAAILYDEYEREVK